MGRFANSLPECGQSHGAANPAAASLPRMHRARYCHVQPYLVISSCMGGGSARLCANAGIARSCRVRGTFSECRNLSTSAASRLKPWFSSPAAVRSQSCCTALAVCAIRPGLADRPAGLDPMSRIGWRSRSRSTRDSPRCAARKMPSFWWSARRPQSCADVAFACTPCRRSWRANCSRHRRRSALRMFSRPPSLLWALTTRCICGWS
jgi:hypothetical protein